MARNGISSKNKNKRPVGKPKRSSKHKERQTPSEHVQREMRCYLASIGCQLVEVEADGNCLFRALSDQLFGSQEHHATIRQRLVEFIEANRVDFECFMEDDEAFDHYCARMKEDGVWGGNQEIFAAAQHFNVWIVIHQQSGHRMVIECACNPPKSVLHLCYHHGEDHYDSMRMAQDNAFDHPPKPIVLDVNGLRPEELDDRFREKKRSEIDQNQPHDRRQSRRDDDDPLAIDADALAAELDKSLSLKTPRAKRSDETARRPPVQVLSRKEKRQLKLNRLRVNKTT